MRTRSCVRAGIAALCVSCVVAPASAQRYHVQTYTETDGLPSSNVLGISQDSSGRMWFVTRAGIAAYDGVEWESHDAHHPLPVAEDVFLRFDGRDRLWIVGHERRFQAVLYDGTRYETIPTPPEPGLEGPIGAAAVGDLGGTTLLALATDAGQLLLWDEKDWRAVSTGPLGEVSEITALLFAGRQLLIGTPHGAYTLAAADSGATPAPVEGTRGRLIRGFCRAREGSSVWLVGPDWVGTLAAGRFSTLASGLDLPGSQGHPHPVMAADREGGLYLTYFTGLFRFHPGSGIERLDEDNGLIAGGGYALHVDREGNVWIGTPRGVSKIVSYRFASFQSRHGLLSDEVTAILQRRGGGIVLGHPHGLTLMDGAVATLPLEEAIAGTRVLDLAEGLDGRVWAAVERHGLAEIRGRSEVRWHLGMGSLVRSVRADEAGRLWVASSRGLFERREDGTLRRIERPADISAAHIRRIFLGGGGDVYLATATAGVHRYREGEWRSWIARDDPPGNSIFALLLEDDRDAWVGTSGGLYRLRKEGLVKVVGPGPRVDRPVYFLTRDQDDRMWIGIDNGVLRWDGKALRHFTVEDGLIGRETNRSAGMVDSANQVWIGTERGVSVYRRERDLPRLAPPVVELLGLRAKESTYPLERDVELSAGQNSILIRYRTISFADEHRVRVHSWLEGFDESWLPGRPASAREIRYTSLPPGTYRFHLQARTLDGARSDVVSSAAIVVRPPWWHQDWVALLVAGLIAFAGFSVHRFLSQHRYARRLEREVREKVAALRRSEDRLRRVREAEKRRLEVTLGSIADGVIATNRQGRVTFLNRAAMEITGWSLRDALWQPASKVLALAAAEDASAGASDPVSRILAQVVSIGPGGPLTLHTRQGRSRLVEISGAPMRDNDVNPSGAVIAFRDITEKRRIEDELARTQRLDALGVLAGGIAHDFNNLMAVALGSLSVLKLDNEVSAGNRAGVARAEAAIVRARDLTRQLLTFSRGGAPVREAASIAEVIQDSASFVMRGTSVRLEIDLAEDLRVVNIDSGQMSQVIQNLLLNAMEAMPDGGTVRIEGRNLERGPEPLPPGGYVEVVVRDEGRGIPPDHLDRVFDPYFSTKEKGNGLGLASAYSIVARHDGLLTAESERGQGSVFRVYLPVSRGGAAALAANEWRLVRGRDERILVMDDEAGVRDVIGEQLVRLGYRVELAADGAGAIDLYADALERGTPFDAVIMDLTVPGGLGGREAIRRLRSIDPEIKAIVVSGYSNDPVMAEYHSYGFVGCVSKPFDAAQLATVLRDVLEPPASEPS